jgi:prepilin-type processing-associated H-X9-DG protein
MLPTAVCLSHLGQWGQAFQMYLNDSHGKGMHGLEISQRKRWWEILAPYNGNVRGTLLCPETSERGMPSGPDQNFGSASRAWWSRRGDYLGSYGLNYWIFVPAPGAQILPSRIRLPAPSGERIPLLADCCWAWSDPHDSDVVPRNLEYPEDGIPNGLGVFCIDRHQMSINVVFLDGHAEHLPLAELWKLKWSADFVPRDVVVPRP